VQALLLELEHLAVDKFSFPEVAARIHESGGERLNAVNIRRWRKGTEFPTEDAVRRWALLCGGDVASLTRQYGPARDAYFAWKADGRPVAAAPSDGVEVAASAVPLIPRRPLRPRWLVLAGAVAVVTMVGIAGYWYWPRPADEFVVGTCVWPVRAHPAIDPVPPGGALVYKIPSGEGSRDIAVLPGGALLQPFVASASRISTVASIIGLDGNRTDVTKSHSVRFEIILPHPTNPPSILARQDTEVTPANVNKDVALTFTSPVAVDVGTVYVLRVENRSPATIGFYVNSPSGPDRLAPYPEDVCVEKAEGPFTRIGWSMSGFVAAAN
jgi:hypothetical protein